MTLRHDLDHGGRDAGHGSARRLPKGERKADPTFGTVQVYQQPFEAIKGGKAISAFLMGVLSAVIVGPCKTPTIAQCLFVAAIA